MSATSSPSQPVSACASDAAPGDSSAIDASLRVPVLLLFLGGAGWLLLSSFLGFLATLKFHQPELLADCPCLTYGRVFPAATNAFLYGFAVQAGLGVLLWVLCHLGRAKLAAPALTLVGWLFWNLGVTVGILGILGGGSTGFEWLELPRYASVPMFLAYLAVGVAAMLSFHQRVERRLAVAHWFLLAALLWFPWIYSTANLLLVAHPVRGTLQSVIDWWYANNLSTIWFGFAGLGAAFYLVPKLVNRPLYSHGLGIFTFWTLAIFGSWGMVPAGAPVPSWMPALSTFAAIMTVVPVLAVAVNMKQTSCGHAATGGGPAITFLSFGMLAYVASGLLGAVTSLAPVSEITNFTWLLPAQQRLFLYGFFAMTMFGAVYYIVPRLAGIEFPSPKLISYHFGLSAAGLLIYCIPMMVGGVKQGFALNDHTIPFLNVVEGTLPFIRVSTTGDLLMAVGHLLFLWNLLGLLCRLGRASLTALIAASGKPAGVAA